ncbi:MAG TPA: hypothetical protein VGJ53_08750 [Micromonosporaceae bacterium]
MPTSADPDTSGHDAYHALAEWCDPMLREIGVQLRDGHLRPRDVLTAGAYRPVLLRALENVRRQEATAGREAHR